MSFLIGVLRPGGRFIDVIARLNYLLRLARFGSFSLSGFALVKESGPARGAPPSAE